MHYNKGKSHAVVNTLKVAFKQSRVHFHRRTIEHFLIINNERLLSGLIYVCFSICWVFKFSPAVFVQPSNFDKVQKSVTCSSRCWHCHLQERSQLLACTLPVPKGHTMCMLFAFSNWEVWPWRCWVRNVWWGPLCIWGTGRQEGRSVRWRKSLLPPKHHIGLAPIHSSQGETTIYTCIVCPSVSVIISCI